MYKNIIRVFTVLLTVTILAFPVYADESEGEKTASESGNSLSEMTDSGKSADEETAAETQEETTAETSEETKEETEEEKTKAEEEDATEAPTEAPTEAATEAATEAEAETGAEVAEETAAEEPASETPASNETADWELIYPDAEVGTLTDSPLTSGLLQVYLGYAFPDGSFDIWYACPGFAVNRNTAVTSDRILLSAPDGERYLRILEKNSEGYSNLGIDLHDWESLKKDLQYRIYCGGILIPAGLVTSGDGMLVLDVQANLAASYKFSNEKAAFEDKIYAIGALDRIISGNDRITRANILEQSVQISSISADGTIMFSLGSHEYFVGGPIVSETGAVLGIVTNTGDGSGESIPKEKIQDLLKSVNRTYKVGEKRILADYTPLRSAVNEAGKVDKTLYTEESLKVLESALDEGRGILSLNDKHLSQTKIDQAASRITSAISGLKEAEKKQNSPVILLGIIFGVILLAGAVFILIKSRKPKNSAEDDYEYLDDNRSGIRKKLDDVIEKYQMRKQMKQEMKGKPERKPVSEKKDKPKTPHTVEMKQEAPAPEPETVIAEDDESATLLIEETPLRILRRTTGEVITISSFPYVFGHSQKSANYVLEGKTVSRTHFQIDKTAEGTVIIRDLHSTNGTSLNGVRIDPDKDEKTLSPEDVIVIPGEEFEILEGVS